jgi:8-oxo-dGTP diphosphatase
MGSKPERKKSTSCGTVVHRRLGDKWEDTEILLIKQFAHKDSWGIPKGHLNEGETFEECAIRETREEAGVDVALEERMPDIYAIYKKEDKTVVSFLAHQVCNKQPSANDPDSEVVAARWFKFNELPQIHSYQVNLMTMSYVALRKRFDGVIDDPNPERFPPGIERALKTVFTYAASVDDWLTLKKQLLLVLNSDDKSLFSRRHDVTRKQVPNDFERRLAKLWSKMTGREMKLPPS